MASPQGTPTSFDSVRGARALDAERRREEQRRRHDRPSATSALAQALGEPAEACVVVVTGGEVGIGERALVGVAQDDRVEREEAFARRARDELRVPAGALSQRTTPMPGRAARARERSSSAASRP